MTNPLRELMYIGESGEAGYNAYNRGTYRDHDGRERIRSADRSIDFSRLTLGEVLDLQHLERGNPNRLFAVGKYQIIPDTMDDAAEKLRLDRNQAFSPELQDRIFSEYLITQKRPAIHGYIVGRPDISVRDAQRALAQEWASFGDPDRDGRSFYGGANRASITPEQSASALEQMRTQYQASISAGLTPGDAWRAAISMGPGDVRPPIDRTPTPDRNDPTIRTVQENLNQLGITDARGQPLAVDGNRGGPNSRTNEAIAAFQQRFGLEGRVSNTELLTATQAALSDPVRNAEQAARDVLPPGLQTLRPVPASGIPDYLLPGRSTATHNNNAPPPAAELPSPPAVELQYGDRGGAVLALQEHLRLVGATDRDGRELNPDRHYGNRTREAVEQFQLWTGLPTTGVADKNTLTALQAQSQFVVRQRALGLPAGSHLADNLQPAAAEAAVAGNPRPPQSGETARDAASIGGRGSRNPDDPGHPDHEMLEQIRVGVHGLDRGAGKPYDEASERLSRSLLAASKDNRDLYSDRGDIPLSANALSRVDHVVLGRDGRYAFAVQGDLYDPAHKRAAVDVEQAVRTPVEQSDAKLEAANRQIARELQLAQQQELQRQQDAPARNAPIMH